MEDSIQSYGGRYQESLSKQRSAVHYDMCTSRKTLKCHGSFFFFFFFFDWQPQVHNNDSVSALAFMLPPAAGWALSTIISNEWI